MMKVSSTFVLFASVFIGCFINWIMTFGLPQKVATHFDISGNPDRFMTLQNHQIFIVLFTLVFPLFIVFMVGVVPAWFPSLVNISNRDYWFASERKKQTLDYLYAMAVRLGIIMVLFFVGLNILTIKANNSKPVVLPIGVFFTLLSGFLISVFVWVFLLFMRFKKTDSPPR